MRQQGKDQSLMYSGKKKYKQKQRKNGKFSTQVGPTPISQPPKLKNIKYLIIYLLWQNYLQLYQILMTNSLKSIILVCFLLLLSSSFTTQESSIGRLNVRRNHNQWILNLICLPSKQPCSFQYTSVPSQWIQQHQTIKVPLKNIRRASQQTIRVKVRDWRQRQVQQEIKLSLDQQKIIMISKKVVSNEDPKNAVIKQSQNSRQKNKNNLILKNQYQLSWMQKNGIKSFLPSISYFGQIIESGDSLQISRTIQNIISDKSECEQKIQYLKEIYQKFDQILQGNKDSLKKEKEEKEKREFEILRLENERDLLEREKKEGVYESKDALKKREKELVSEKSSSFSKHYSLMMIANKYLRKLEQQRGENRLRDDEKKVIVEEIKKEEKEMEDIDQKIRALYQKKAKLEKNVKYNKDKIKDSEDDEIEDDKIQKLQQKYQQYLKKSSQYKSKYRKTEQQLEEVRQKLSTSTFQSDQCEKRLKIIEEQLYKIQTNHISLRKHQDLIQILQRNRPKIEQEVEGCQEKIKENAKEFQNQSTFTSYHNKINDLAETKIPSKSNFYHLYPFLQKINIFSMNWVLKYGVPSTYSFSCKFREHQTFGYGIITAMSKGSIRVRDENGEIFALSLGICSLLKGIDKNFVPKIGDVIEWKGGIAVTGTINIYNACIFSNYT